MTNNIDPIEWGKFLEKLDVLSDKVDKIDNDVDQLKRTMNKGWGIVIGCVMVLGLFANELIEWFKNLIGGRAA